MTFEDGTGLVECTLPPKVFGRCGGVLQGRGPYVMRGLVEERLGGGMGLNVREIHAPRQDQ